MGSLKCPGCYCVYDEEKLDIYEKDKGEEYLCSLCSTERNLFEPLEDIEGKSDADDFDDNPDIEIDEIPPPPEDDNSIKEPMSPDDEETLYYRPREGVFIDFQKLGYSAENKCLQFRLKNENRELMFWSIAAKYPEYFDPTSWITDIGKNIDGYIVRNPQNVAYELKKIYEPFMKEEGRPKTYMLDLPSLYLFYKDHDPNIPIERWKEYSQRVELKDEEKIELRDKFENKCAITGITLDNEVIIKNNKQTFCSQLKIIEFDHRIPLYIDPDQDQSHDTAFMLLSKYINIQKRHICTKCKVDNKVNCRRCGLAYPEDFSIIVPTGQNISEFRNKNWDFSR